MKRILLLIIPLLFSTIINAQGWGQTQKIVPSDRFLGQQFGADVDIDGNYAVVGMKPSANETNAYVFENDGTGNWVQIQKLQCPDYHQYSHFGYSVAISGDYIFVGAWGHNYDAMGNNYLNASGAVYIFKKQSSGSFAFEQKIVASDREALNAFGYALAVNGDYAVVSPVRHDYDETGNNFLDDAGAAYIFERDGSGIWNEMQKIVASDRDVQDFFGQTALAVSNNYIVVGAFPEDEDENGANTIPSAGAAYIFERATSGTWSEIQKIVASDRAQGAYFGWSITIDGNHLVVGSNQDNNFAGSAYVFEKNGSGIWNEVQKLTASTGLAGDRFGQSIAIDGERTIIGAWLTDIGNVSGGAAFMFEKDGTGFWNETAVMYDPEAHTDDQFGFSVAISGDYAMVGAYQEDEDENGENYLSGAGSVYIFDVNEPNTLPPLNTLSVVEVDFELKIKAYPNPVQDILNLELGSHFKTFHITILNTLGQKVFSENYRNLRRIEVDFYNQSKGLYIVELASENQIQSRVKVIKQ